MNGESGSPVFLRREGNLSAMAGNDPVGNRKSQSSALHIGLCGIKWFKDEVLLNPADAYAGIFHMYTNSAIAHACTNLESSSAGGHRVDGIDNQIEKNLSYLPPAEK